MSRSSHATRPSSRSRSTASSAGAALVAAVVVLTTAPRAAAAQLTPSACDAVAGNLVANCGFETGNLSGWSVPAPPNSPAMIGNSAGNSGVYGAIFNQVGGFGTATGYGAIRQTLATNPGQAYTISFFGYTNAPGPDNGIRLLFDGVTVFSQPLLNNAFQRFTTTGVAATASVVFEVQGYNDPGRDFVDDFVITPAAAATVTPEPATWVLLGAGLLACGAAARRRAAMG